MKKCKIVRIAAMLILIVFVVSSAAQAVLITATNQTEKSVAVNMLSGTSFIWEDDFLDESGIDIQKSYNYIVDKSVGKVIMKDTFEAWYNSDWTRMKPIEINNRGSTTFEEYVLDITVYYDSDMKSDFSDLRFTDDEGNDLYYWKGEKVNGESANILVRVPEVTPGKSMIYMFYGDPTAEDESNFDMIFTMRT